MSDDIVLELLRAIRGDIGAVRDDIRDLKHIMVTVELGMAAVRREIAVKAEGIAHLSVKYDAFGDRLERIERRPDIIPAQRLHCATILSI